MIVKEDTVIAFNTKEQLDFLLLIADKYMDDSGFSSDKREWVAEILDNAPLTKVLYFDFNWHQHADYASFVDEYESVISFDDFLSTIKVKKSKISKKGFGGGWLHYINVEYDLDTIDILEKILQHNDITEEEDSFGSQTVVIFDDNTYQIDDDSDDEEIISFNKFIKKYTKVKGAKKNLD